MHGDPGQPPNHGYSTVTYVERLHNLSTSVLRASTVCAPDESTLTCARGADNIRPFGLAEMAVEANDNNPLLAQARYPLQDVP